MRFLVAISLFSIVFFSCEKDEKNSNPQGLEGVYSGTFVRTGMDTASVQLTFSNYTYTGSSSIEKYPAICNGSFELGTSSIEFKDACTWAADFDWTLSLNGNFTLQMNGDELNFYRTSGSTKDEYRLKRISR